jgi:hypothetical protein
MSSSRKLPDWLMTNDDDKKVVTKDKSREVRNARFQYVMSARYESRR